MARERYKNVQTALDNKKVSPHGSWTQLYIVFFSKFQRRVSFSIPDENVVYPNWKEKKIKKSLWEL